MKIAARHISNHFTKVVRITRWKLNIILSIFLFVGASIGSYLTTTEFLIPRLYAASSPWSQTDWSSGVASGTVNGTVATYESATNIDTSTSGQISLSGAAIATFKGNQLSDSTTNFNVATKTALKYNSSQDYNDSVFSYDAGSPTRLTVDADGNYFFSLTIPVTSNSSSTGNRNAIEAEVRINGTKQDIGLARSTYIRNSSQNESSAHLSGYLDGLSAGDYVEIFVARTTTQTSNTLTGNFTLYAEQIADSETVFWATGTRTDASTNLNSSESAMQWSEIVEDSGFTHSADSSTVTIDTAGDYFVSVNIPLGGAVSRGNIFGRVELDGSLVDGGLFQQGYIRNYDSHTDSSIHWSGVVTTTGADQDLQITVQQEGAGGTITTDSEKATLYIQELPSDETGIYHGEGTTVNSGSDWNPAAAAIDWATDNIIDTDVYTKADTQTISVDESGDYLVAFNWAGTSSGTRVNPIGQVQVNGSDVTGATTKTGYMRQSGHDNASGNLLIPLIGLSADDDITINMDREGATTATNDSTPGVLLLWKKGYANSGTLTSNIFDVEYGASWGNLTYTTSGVGSVEVKVRTDSSSDMSGATDWSSCSAISSGSDMSDDSCVDDNDRYVQYQVTLTPSSGQTPVLEDIDLAFSSYDTTAPDTNATSIALSGAVDGEWTNSEPTITWTAGADVGGGSGLLGYCVSLDEADPDSSSSLDPASSSGALTGIDDGVDLAHISCPYVVVGTSFDLSGVSGLDMTSGKQYYFSIKAVDNAGNVWSGVSGSFQDLVSFKYDAAVPTNVSYISTPGSNFSNVVDMSFSWPTSGGSGASDDDSGILGYQYQINGTDGTWKGTDTDSTCGVDYIPQATGSYDLTEEDDAASIAEGNNVLYFRAIDIACNTSSVSTYRTGNLAFAGEAPSFETSCEATNGVVITPTTSDTNSFALSWEDATPADGQSLDAYYYMINTSPPSLLTTITSNTATYLDNGTSTSVSADTLTGAVKGANTVYVVAVDDADNYSASNCLKGTFTLDSELPDPPKDLLGTDASIKSSSLWRASLGWDEPDYTGVGALTYQVERSTDNTNWTAVATTTGTSYIDTVTDSSLYYWRVGAYDTSSESQASPSYATAVSLTPKGTYSDPADLSSGPTASTVTTRQATITWSTSRASDSKVSYGTSSGSYFTEEPSNSDQLTDHTITLNGLEPGTTYYYKAKWTDEDGNTGTSTEKSFTTDPAPSVSNVAATSVGLSTAIIDFTVTNTSKATVLYGTSTSYGGIREITTSNLETESTYTVQLTDLDDGTEYHYKIQLEDAEGEEYEFEDHIFETLPRPEISNVRIQQVKGTAQPTVLVTWDTNTEVSSIVTYYPEGSPSLARDEVNVALTDGEHRMIVRGLGANTVYSLIVKGRDKLGNEAISDVQRITTATDTRPPQISELSVEGSTKRIGDENQQSAQLVVSWNTDEASTSQVEYGEGTGSTYSQKTQEDSNKTFNHLVVISGLTPSKVYHLRAISADESGNVGNSIDTVTITPKASRSALDLVITNLSEVFGFLR